MRVWLTAAALVVLVAAVFAPVRHHEFVNYDDHWFVVDHPVVQRGISVSSVQWAFDPANAFVGTGGPLTWLSHMLDVQMFGMKPGPHHLVNVALHALNSVLLLVALWTMTGALARSACVAALFAIHPLHVESVAWIAERKDVLSTTFWMLATIVYVQHVRRPTVWRYTTVFMLLTLGLLAKPVVATLPFVLLLLDVWPLARAPRRWEDRGQWRPLVREKIPLLLPAVVVMILTVGAQAEIGAVAGAGNVAWSLRVMNAVVAYGTYLWKTIWPTHLAVFYPYPAAIALWKVALALCAIVAISLVAWRMRRTRPYVAVGWLWFLGALIPMIGLVQVGSHSMADRFTYVPLAGIFIAVVWGVPDLAVWWRPRGLTISAAAALVTIALLSVVARAQVNTWRNSETMWTQALGATTGNFRAHAGLAEVAAARGDQAAAIAGYREALRLAPDAADWHVNLALLLTEHGDLVEATDAFRRALKLRPDDAKSHNSLGALLARQGRVEEAIAEYRRALGLMPHYALAHRNLGLAYASSGNFAAGLNELLEAIRLAPEESQWRLEAAVIGKQVK